MVIFHSYVKLPEGKMLLIDMQPRDVCSEGGRITRCFLLKKQRSRSTEMEESGLPRDLHPATFNEYEITVIHVY
jgi:hypothetical protein